MAEPERNPYVGPYAFEKEDADFFYGREREAQILPSIVISESVTLFCAQSGAGKTSLLNAKLVPELTREGFKVLPVARVGGELPAGIEPENVYAFNAVWSLTGSARDPRDLRDLSLDEHLRLNARDEERNPPRRVLILDQFEEILTTYPSRWSQREDFFLQLRQALLDDSALSVVLVMREDHVAGLDRYASFLPGQLRSRFRMERLRIEDAVEAVRRPAEAAGRPFEDGVAELLVENLSQLHFAGQKKTAPGEFVEPVQLQVVCFQLWENLRGTPGPKITGEDLKRSGKVDEALEKFYREAVENAARETEVPEKQIRQWCGSRLITPSQIRSQVARETETTGGLPNAAVDRLVTAHLIRPEDARGGVWYELAHDRFIDPVLRSNEQWMKERELPLSADARAWRDAGGALHFLYQGDRLAQAQALLKEDPGAFGELERTFLERSQEEVNRSSRSRIRILALAALIFAALAILAVWQWQVARQERQISASRELALVALGKAETNPDLGLLLALEALDQSRTPEAAAALHAALSASVVRKAWSVTMQSANEVAFSPDGTHLAAVGDDDEIGLWESDPHKEVFLRTEKEPVSLTSVAFDRSGKRLATGDDLGQVRVRDVGSGRVLDTLPVKLPSVNGLAFSPAGDLLAIASASPEVIVWNLQKKDPPIRLSAPGHEGVVWDVAFSREGLLATAHDNGQVLVWDPINARQVNSLPRQRTEVTAVAFSPDGKLATAGLDKVARIWDLKTHEEIRFLLGHEHWIWDLDFSPDGRYLVTGSQDRSARIWDVALGGRELQTLLPGSGPVMSVAFGPRPGQVVTASQAVEGVEESGAIVLWEVLLDSDVETLVNDRARFNSVDFSPDGAFIAAADQKGRVSLWNLSGERPLDLVAPKNPPVQDIKFSKDGMRLAAARTDGTVLLWEVSSPGHFARAPSSLHDGKESLTSATFASDGRRLATVDQAGLVKIWDVARLSEPHLLSSLSGKGRFHDAAFSPDGRWLATASSDGSAYLWDLSAGGWRPFSLRHSSPVLKIAFSPDGKRLATVDEQRSIRLWDVERGDRLLDPLQGHASEITGIAFHPDGSQLATSSSDHTVKLWDSELGLELFTLRGHSNSVTDLAFSPDGKLLATAGADGKVRLEPLALEDLIKLARQRLRGRTLSAKERRTYLRH